MQRGSINVMKKRNSCEKAVHSGEGAALGRRKRRIMKTHGKDNEPLKKLSMKICVSVDNIFMA